MSIYLSSADSRRRFSQEIVYNKIKIARAQLLKASPKNYCNAGLFIGTVANIDMLMSSILPLIVPISS